jgi:predicted RND superfamily exporter protein
LYLKQKKAMHLASASGAAQQNTLGGRQAMEKKIKDSITTRGWLVIWLMVLALTIWFTTATADVCYVGEQGNWLGYGSCSAMIDGVVGK